MSDQPATVPTALAASGAGQQLTPQVTPRMTPQGAVQGAGQGGDQTGAKTTLEGMVTLTIAKHQFTLAGTLAKSAVIVEYHADFADAVTLGTVEEITSEIASLFGIGDLQTDIDAALAQIQNLPGIANLASQLLTASVRITDLVINTATSTYAFGMGLDFSANPPTLLGIALDSIGFKVTRSKPAPPAPNQA
jgi:hypothetical protein